MLKLFVFFSMLLLTTKASYAQAEAPDFYGQLKLIIALAEADQFKSIQGDFISTDPEDGSKTYSFPLPLDGFNTSMVQNANGKLVIAMGKSNELAQGHIWSLMNGTMRTIHGMPYYENSDYKAANPAGLESFESVTELKKENGLVSVQIYKMPEAQGYFMLIIPIK